MALDPLGAHAPPLPYTTNSIIKSTLYNYIYGVAVAAVYAQQSLMFLQLETKYTYYYTY